MSECNLKTLPNGLKIVVFKGTFTETILSNDPKTDGYGGRVPPEKRQYTPFKGAILQTKSNKWPGMTIYFEETEGNFAFLEKLFDKIIESLSYSK